VFLYPPLGLRTLVVVQRYPRLRMRKASQWEQALLLMVFLVAQFQRTLVDMQLTVVSGYGGLMRDEDLPPGIEVMGSIGFGSVIVCPLSRTCVMTLIELLQTDDASIHPSLDADSLGSHAFP